MDSSMDSIYSIRPSPFPSLRNFHVDSIKYYIFVIFESLIFKFVM
jgi:hypothetical protein